MKNPKLNSFGSFSYYSRSIVAYFLLLMCLRVAVIEAQNIVPFSSGTSISPALSDNIETETAYNLTMTGAVRTRVSIYLKIEKKNMLIINFNILSVLKYRIIRQYVPVLL